MSSKWSSVHDQQLIVGGHFIIDSTFPKVVAKLSGHEIVFDNKGQTITLNRTYNEN